MDTNRRDVMTGLAGVLGTATIGKLAMADERPVGQIPGVVDLNPGKPLEGRGGDIVIITDPDDGRVGIEAPKNGVFDNVT